MPINLNQRIANKVRGTDDITQAPGITRHKGHVVSVQSDGTATVTIDGDPRPVADTHSDANYVPKAGDDVELEVQGGDTTIIGMYGTTPTVYRGIAAATPVTADETISGGSYGDVTTPGPSASVTVTSSGRLMVIVSCTMTITDNNDGGFMSFALSGANTRSPSDDSALQFKPKVSGTYFRASYVEMLTGLTPGATTVTAKYKTDGADVTFKDRKLQAIPL